eukprot:scaffold82045_cov60-Phaeocystis_antarctica.AAC.3
MPQASHWGRVRPGGPHPECVAVPIARRRVSPRQPWPPAALTRRHFQQAGRQQVSGLDPVEVDGLGRLRPRLLSGHERLNLIHQLLVHRLRRSLFSVRVSRSEARFGAVIRATREANLQLVLRLLHLQAYRSAPQARRRKVEGHGCDKDGEHPSGVERLDEVPAGRLACKKTLYK